MKNKFWYISAVLVFCAVNILIDKGNYDFITAVSLLAIGVGVYEIYSITNLKKWYIGLGVFVDENDEDEDRSWTKYPMMLLWISVIVVFAVFVPAYS